MKTDDEGLIGYQEIKITLYALVNLSDRSECYQWRGNDGKVYSPEFTSLEEAKKFPNIHPLRPLNEVTQATIL